MLKRFDHIPPGFLDAKPTELVNLLEGPSLIHLKGEKEPALFVSILLHGNETSSLTILQQILKKHLSTPLPSSLLLFVGNIYAAKEGVRKLNDGPDYNRIWKETGYPECQLAREVIHAAKKLGVQIAIDIHNNSGKNPVYGSIRDLDKKHKALAKLFSPLAMHAPLPKETLSHTFSDFCTSITLECGLPGCPEGIIKGIRFVENCLKNGLHETPSGSLTIYNATARIGVPQGTPVHFANHNTLPGFTFPDNFDLWNFTLLPKGHVFGYRSDHSLELLVLDEDKTPLSQSYFWYRGNEIIVEKPFIPAMLTQNVPIIFQDCLGYAMEPCPE